MYTQRQTRLHEYTATTADPLCCRAEMNTLPSNYTPIRREKKKLEVETDLRSPTLSPAAQTSPGGRGVGGLLSHPAAAQGLAGDSPQLPPNAQPPEKARVVSVLRR